jgi:phage-related holin
MYPAAQFILLVGFFIAADTITGVVAANKRGEKLTSKRGSDVIRKFLVYGVGVIVAHVVQREFLSDFPALKIIAGLIAFNELKSIDENIKDISGYSLFDYFIKKLK